MCKIVCWVVAAILGVIVGVMSGLSTIWAIIAAILVFIVLGWALNRWICGDEINASAAPAPMAAPKPAAPAPAASQSAAPATAASPAPAATAAAEPTAAPAPVEAPAPAEAPATASAAHWSAAVAADSGKAGGGRGQTGLKPTAALGEEEKLRDGVGAWKYEGDAAPYRAAAQPAGLGPSSSSPSAAEAAAPAAASEKPASVAPAAPAETAEAAPEILSAARGGVADDLKKIKGVGPGLEKTLNELGFYHFDQIAAWGDAEVAWVDARLKFKGRIVRDNWVAQAKELANG